jgi:hypothetical protein
VFHRQSIITASHQLVFAQPHDAIQDQHLYIPYCFRCIEEQANVCSILFSLKFFIKNVFFGKKPMLAYGQFAENEPWWSHFGDKDLSKNSDILWPIV